VAWSPAPDGTKSPLGAGEARSDKYRYGTTASGRDITIAAVKTSVGR
jgi:hypothetical protein